jgi:hypothetical protein
MKKKKEHFKNGYSTGEEADEQPTITAQTYKHSELRQYKEGTVGMEGGHKRLLGRSTIICSALPGANKLNALTDLFSSNPTPFFIFVSPLL